MALPLAAALPALLLSAAIASAAPDSTQVPTPMPAAPPPPAPVPVPVPAPPGPTVRAWQTGLLRPDRLEHASLAFSIGLGVGLLTREPAVAGGGALALGLAKEIRDRPHGGFDPLDLAADFVGAALAALTTRALER